MKRESMALVASGDADLRMLLEAALSLHGFRVALADNGKDAVSRAVGGLPDCLILESDLPVLSGLEVLRNLRALGATQRLPVIFLARRPGELDEVPLLLAGTDQILEKPFTLKKLLGALHRAGEHAVKPPKSP